MPVGSGGYPGGSPSITVQALLKQPTRISRDLASLVYQRLVADRLFLHGSPDEAAGGSMIYQEAESIFVDTPGAAEEIAVAADWPRVGWSEALKQAFVKQYGLEVAIDDLAIRRNQISRVVRGTRKIANNLVKFLDTKALAVITGASTLTGNASAAWGTITTDIIGDIATWQAQIEAQNNGYNGFQGATLVLNPDKRLALLSNTALRAALPREVQNGPVQTGFMAPILGLKEILFTPQLASATAILMDTSVAGTMVDEQPDPIEGWQAYDPGAGARPIYTKVYTEDRNKGHVIAAGRWPAMAVTDPKAIFVASALV